MSSMPPPPRVGPGGYSPSEPDVCRSYKCFSFCSFALECEYKHPTECDPPKRDIPDLMAELDQVGRENADGIYVCRVCDGNVPSLPDVGDSVGVTSWYRFCPNCGHFYFYPAVQNIILQILQKHSKDYIAYKAEVDYYCTRLHPLLRIPFMYEAHRWGVGRFAWSLLGQDNATEALERLYGHNNTFNRMVSMGAGTGYVEYVFETAATAMGRTLEVCAFDECPGKVCHVKVKTGGAEAMDTLGDMKDTFLLLSWPPFGGRSDEQSTMANDTTKRFLAAGGKWIVYIGDIHATGDWRFHDLLWSHFEPDNKVPFRPLRTYDPQSMGLTYGGNDVMNIYCVKEDAPPV